MGQTWAQERLRSCASGDTQWARAACCFAVVVAGVVGQVLAQAPPAFQDLPSSDTTLPDMRRVAAPGMGLGDYDETAYRLSELNAGLAPVPDTFFRVSPQETVESFARACRAGRFETAAHALNLNLFPASRHAELGPVLAQELYYVLDQRIGLSWGTIPDRPDGAATVAGPGVGQVGAPRRSVSVGSLQSEGREIELRLQRVRVEGGPPAWVWAATTVEEIPGLYAAYGPGFLEQRMPPWARSRVFGLPLWVVVGLIVGVGLCWGFGWLVYRGLRWACETLPFEWADVLGERLARPVGVAVGTLAFYFLLRDVLALSGPLARGLFFVLLVVVVGVMIWVVSRAIDYVIGFFIERNLADISDEANDSARRRLTTLSVARRVLVFVLLVVGVAIVFSRVNGLEGVGYALLSSAGFAAIILGIAAQSTLGNLVAGIQIALTRPVRIGDTVLYGGDYGNVEDVRFTYLVIRTWDLRRLVVPLKYFIDHPFENWSMTDSKLLKTFYLHVDFGADVEAIRAKFDELVRGHELYNGHKDPDLLVYAIEDDGLRLRGTVSAEDASKAWTLHCDVREAMSDYLATLAGGRYLPRERYARVENGR